MGRPLEGLMAAQYHLDRETRPGASVFHEGQMPWGHWYVGSISAASATKALDLTVPSGYNWHLTLAMVYCECTVRQKVVLSITPGLDSDFWYEGELQLPLHSESGFLIQGGTSVEVYLYNNDISARDFTGVLLGILEAV